jgi:hypothetical protein
MRTFGNRIIRSICWFAESTDPRPLDELDRVSAILTGNGYTIQTRRVCFRNMPIASLASWSSDQAVYLSAGGVNREAAWSQLNDFLRTDRVAFNLDATTGIEDPDAEMLLRIISESPANTFRFAFTFNNAASSPFFPSADFGRPGFSVGLQPTDLAENCSTLEEWMSSMERVWLELALIFGEHPGFLGIDSSTAPLFLGKSSLIHFVKRICGSFSRAASTELFLRLSEFIRSANPKPVGLCGLMLPCLEDFELADEYEAGEFTIERNLFLSLHSGLGIDTYPLGIDENPGRILEVLRLVQRLSAKYDKPLSVRFVSDGKARIGDMTDFRNEYLKDVRVRPL